MLKWLIVFALIDDKCKLFRHILSKELFLERVEVQEKRRQIVKAKAVPKVRIDNIKIKINILLCIWCLDDISLLGLPVLFAALVRQKKITSYLSYVCMCATEIKK